MLEEKVEELKKIDSLEKVDCCVKCEMFIKHLERIMEVILFIVIDSFSFFIRFVLFVLNEY